MEKSNNKIHIWVAIITTFGIIVVALIQAHPWKSAPSTTVQHKESKYFIGGTVIDESTNVNISQAEISIVGRNEHYYTEENGNFRITLLDSIQVVRVRVIKKNYLPFDKSYNIPTESIIIQLKQDNPK